MQNKSNFRSEYATIVLVHGNSSSWKIFKDYFERVSDYSKVAISLPGHDNFAEEELKGETSLFQFYSKKLIQFINSIGTDILLVGHSLGGHLAMEIANEVRNLKGLVVAGAPPLEKPLNIEEALFSSETLGVFLKESPGIREIEEMSETIVHDNMYSSTILSAFKQSSSRVRKLLSHDLESGILRNQRELFVNLDLPKFIIHGMQDPTVRFEYLYDLSTDVKNRFEIHKIDDCGHYPSLEQPEKFANIMNRIAESIFKNEPIY